MVEHLSEALAASGGALPVRIQLANDQSAREAVLIAADSVGIAYLIGETTVAFAPWSAVGLVTTAL